MKKSLSTISFLFLFVLSISVISPSFVSANSNTFIPSCNDYISFKKVYEGYLDIALPVYMNPELTKLNKPQVDTFTKQANSWIGKQVEGDFLGDGTTAVGSKVQFELNKISKRYTLLRDIHSSLNSDGKGIEDVNYTVDGIKKLLTADDDFSKAILCSPELSDSDIKKIRSSLEKTKKILNSEADRIKGGKLPKSYAKSVNLAIWKQKVLFETNNSESSLQENCKYESELEAYNCGG